MKIHLDYDRLELTDFGPPSKNPILMKFSGWEGPNFYYLSRLQALHVVWGLMWTAIKGVLNVCNWK